MDKSVCMRSASVISAQENRRVRRLLSVSPSVCPSLPPLLRPLTISSSFSCPICMSVHVLSVWLPLCMFRFPITALSLSPAALRKQSRLWKVLCMDDQDRQGSHLLVIIQPPYPPHIVAVPRFVRQRMCT